MNDYNTQNRERHIWICVTMLFCYKLFNSLFTILKHSGETEINTKCITKKETEMRNSLKINKTTMDNCERLRKWSKSVQ